MRHAVNLEQRQRGRENAQMIASDLAWRAEETCLNAWPALRSALLSGWVVRFSGGLTRRANSANSLGVRGADREVPIAECEQLYRHHHLPTIFRVISIVEPAIDETLAARGYSSEGLSIVLYGNIDAIRAVRDPEVLLRSRPTSGWLATMAALQNHTTREAGLYRQIIGRLAIPAAFASISDENGRRC